MSYKALKSMKEKLESLKVKLGQRLADAEDEAKYARSSDQHSINQARAEELAWCYNELLSILGDLN